MAIAQAEERLMIDSGLRLCGRTLYFESTDIAAGDARLTELAKTAMKTLVAAIPSPQHYKAMARGFLAALDSPVKPR